MWLRAPFWIWNNTKLSRNSSIFSNTGNRPWERRRVGSIQGHVFFTWRKNWRKTSTTKAWTMWGSKEPSYSLTKRTSFPKLWLSLYTLNNSSSILPNSSNCSRIFHKTVWVSVRSISLSAHRSVYFPTNSSNPKSSLDSLINENCPN